MVEDAMIGLMIVGFILFNIHRLSESWRISKYGVRTQGLAVKETRFLSDDRTVGFFDVNGMPRSFYARRMDFGFDRFLEVFLVMFQIDQQKHKEVSVVYLRSDPSSARIDTFMRLWELNLLCIFVGAVLLGMAATKFS